MLLWAIIADGGQAIVVIYTEGEEIKHFFLYFIDSTKTLRWRPWPTPFAEALGVGFAHLTKPCRWRGKRLLHGGGVCELCVSGV
jgi:hypothetical protein